MSIPGFTAEAAIYPVGKTHRTTDVSRTLKPGLEILPALIKPVSPDCHYEVWVECDPFFCYEQEAIICNDPPYGPGSPYRAGGSSGRPKLHHMLNK